MTDATVDFFARSATLGLQDRFSAVPQNLDDVVRFFNERLQDGKGKQGA